jgi:phospholipid transport system substrate-binding protein
MTKIVAASMMLAVACGLGAPAWALTPTEELRQYTDQVLKVLQNPALTPKTRRSAIRDLAIEAFDVSETARRALGPHWQQLTAPQQTEFVRVFKDLLELTYISRIDEYGGERIRYASEKVDGDTGSVRALIITKQGTEVPVESRVVRKGDRWLIYDVLIENVSLVANYRSQFDRVIRSGSYDELVKRLKTRVEQLSEGKDKVAPAR